MQYQALCVAEPAYGLCRYGDSKLGFRGPDRSTGRASCAVLGGGCSFGRFVGQPWPQLLEEEGAGPVLNLAVPQTGPEAWLQDQDLMRLAVRAQKRVIELPGCLWLSNPWYQVHPRRNDRVLRITPRLSALYPEADLSQYLFTGHLMRSLQRLCPQRFARVAAGLQQAWADRMGQLLGDLGGEVWLLQLEPGGPGALAEPLRPDPALLQRFSTRVAGMIRVAVSAGDCPDPVGRCFPDQDSHFAIAQAVGQRLFAG